MNNLVRLAGVLFVLSVFAASSAALSMESPEEVNITEIAEQETSSENITERISYDVVDEPEENTQNIEQKIKQRAERVRQERLEEEKEEDSITGASTESKPSEGFFSAIFDIFS